MGCGSSIQMPAGPKPIVMVLGGGYGGVAAATTLDATGRYFVILIDRKDHFFHNVASLRGGVNDTTAKHTLIPYNKLLTNGIVLQGDIVNVTATNVTLHGHTTPIAFDFIIIATGTSYSFPSSSRVNDRSITNAAARFVDFRSRVSSSNNVVIVGGGAVGIELASEIKETHPKTNVTIVHSGPKLIHAEPRLKDEFITRTTDHRMLLSSMVSSMVCIDEHTNDLHAFQTCIQSHKIDFDLNN